MHEIAVLNTATFLQDDHPSLLCSIPQTDSDDLKQILQASEERGWPGMLGSIDCMHWVWKHCPYGHKSTFSGNEGSPTLIMEAVCDYRLWIWHSFFGMAGSNNGLNVLEDHTCLTKLSQVKPR